MKKLLTVLLFVPVMAHAEFKTGNELYADLNAESTVSRAVGLGYIMGVADATRNMTHCAPAEVTAGQINDMVKKHLANTAELRHYTADIIVSYVLKKAWPCANKPNGRPA